MDGPHPELHERVMAGRLLSLAAARLSSNIGSFGSWLLVGVGAAYSLILANLSSIQEFVALNSIQNGMVLLLISVVLGVIQRWLAAIISGSCESAEAAERIGRELADDEIELDFKVVFREIESATYYPAKWMVRRSFEKAMSGDFAASGRLSGKLAQIQSVVVFAQVGFSVAAIGVIGGGLNV